YVLVYVDDLIITNSHSSFIDIFTHFSLKDLGDLHYFLDVGSERSYSTNNTSHTCLIRRCVAYGAYQVPFPPLLNLTLGSSIQCGDLLSDPAMLYSIVGALQYMTITQPQISYVIDKVCQFMYNPPKTHWMTVKCILRYLKGTLSRGLLLLKSMDISLIAFSHVGCASNLIDCRSRHDFAFYFDENLIN
ncbi:hypothetical protein V2J09_006113, partial [Rumex salicifolius]